MLRSPTSHQVSTGMETRISTVASKSTARPTMLWRSTLSAEPITRAVWQAASARQLDPQCLTVPESPHRKDDGTGCERVATLRNARNPRCEECRRGLPTARSLMSSALRRGRARAKAPQACVRTLEPDWRRCDNPWLE